MGKNHETRKRAFSNRAPLYIKQKENQPIHFEILRPNPTSNFDLKRTNKARKVMPIRGPVLYIRKHTSQGATFRKDEYG